MDNPLEDPPEADPGALVVVGTYGESISAEAVRSCLEMEGIDAEVFDGVISATVYNSVFGGVKVMVRRRDETRARDILESLETSVSEEMVPTQDEIAPGEAHCQACHSRRVRSREYWALPSHPLLRTAARWLSRTTILRCRDCGFAVRS